MKNAELAEAKINPSKFSSSRFLNLRKGYVSNLLIEKFFFLNGIFAVFVLFGIFSILFINGIKANLSTKLSGGERVGIFPPVGGG